jgi:DNA polymerase-3 subunit gamma/tau
MASNSRDNYVVVARRYRPRSFAELVGQGHISTALGNAIATGRVGHAYLFTGARGTGKTSTARIFAKCLNDPSGPTITPDARSDAAEAIDAGEDIDVIEIDGASNRGIDEIRQLRANISVRPSRSRFKIYIIDEVHMLTTGAFNALLKTLEEPPEHVKFIFCTTDPEKIPITVLSRCQRFDFVSVGIEDILGRLREIVKQEGASATEDALRLMARRAGGSMRDSQSLLEQVLSFSAGEITVEKIHQVLGSAEDARVSELSDFLCRRDASAALSALDSALFAGVDAGQLAEQLLGFFRDLMVAGVGGGRDLLRFTPLGEYERLRAIGQELGLTGVLAIVQLLDQAVARMRQSVHSRILLESAIVQICHLPNLQSISSMVDALSAGTSPPTSPATRPPIPKPNLLAEEKKNVESSLLRVDPAHSKAPSPNQTSQNQAKEKVGSRSEPPQKFSSNPAAADEGNPVIENGNRENRLSSSQREPQLWIEALSRLDDLTADYLRTAKSVTRVSSEQFRVAFDPSQSLTRAAIEKGDRRSKLESLLSEVAGHSVQVEFVTSPSDDLPVQVPAPTMSRAQRIRLVEQHPAVQKVISIFNAEVVRIDLQQ